jgi:hypothetical protein
MGDENGQMTPMARLTFNPKMAYLLIKAYSFFVWVAYYSLHGMKFYIDKSHHGHIYSVDA